MANNVENETSAGDQEEIRKFAVGDLAVYPAHGVGRIEAIESKVVNGETHDFYIMKIIENGMVIMIPTWNVKAVGLRDVISQHLIGSTSAEHDVKSLSSQTRMATSTPSSSLFQARQGTIRSGRTIPA